MSDRPASPLATTALIADRHAVDALLAQLVEAAAQRAAAIVLDRLPEPVPVSEFLTIPEAAELLRCKRQRVDDLLSAGRLTRVKDGSRTLIRRAEIAAYLAGDGVTLLTPPAQAGSGSRFAR